MSKERSAHQQDQRGAAEAGLEPGQVRSHCRCAHGSAPADRHPGARGREAGTDGGGREMTDRSYVDYHSTVLGGRVRSTTGTWAAPELPEGAVLFATDDVIAAVAEAFQLTAAVLLGPSREAHISEARDVCWWLLRRHSRLPWKQLGAALNRKDHSTALRAGLRCEERRARDAWFKAHTDDLERKLEEKAKGAAA